MKQNERLLVYAVTGFLALILVVAVVFGDGPKAPVTGAERGGASLSDCLLYTSPSPRDVEESRMPSSA